nr:suppressor of fused domain protein [Arthrobacter sp. 18067]
MVEYEPVFPGGPIHYSTLGLSKTHGRVGGNANDIAYELLMSCAVTGASSVMGSILAQLTRETLESTTPLAFGDVVGPRGLMFENSQMEAVYVRPPEHLPESFSRVVIEVAQSSFYGWHPSLEPRPDLSVITDPGISNSW